MVFNNDVPIMKDLRGYFTSDQIERMIDRCDTDRDKLLIFILARTGRRVSEIIGQRPYKYRYFNNKTKQWVEKMGREVIGLRPRDIDWENGMIAFNILKKKRVTKRMKVVDPGLLDMLDQVIKAYSIELDTPFFSINRKRAYQIVRQAAERAGINALGGALPHPHGLRHGYAINFLKHNPGQIKQLQLILDHSRLDITGHYAQFDQEDIRESVNRAFKH